MGCPRHQERDSSTPCDKVEPDQKLWKEHHPTTPGALGSMLTAAREFLFEKSAPRASVLAPQPGDTHKETRSPVSTGLTP